MSEIIERETEAYYKMDPDPFDDRHPGKFNKNQKSSTYCSVLLLVILLL